MFIEALFIKVNGRNQSTYLYAQPCTPLLFYWNREKNQMTLYGGTGLGRFQKKVTLHNGIRNKQILPSKKRGNKNCIQSISGAESWSHEILYSSMLCL